MARKPKPTALAAAVNIIDEIKTLAVNSEFARYVWTDQAGGRERAKPAYVKGMALCYARVYCKFKAGHPAALEMAAAKRPGVAKDSLTRLNAKFAAEGMSNDVAGIDTLRNLFVLLIGLGISESSGRYCMGRYMNDDYAEAYEAEAGLFQSAYLLTDLGSNPQNAPILRDLITHYTAHQASGFLDVFRTGITCPPANATNWGDPNHPGYAYQQLAKTCPAFAVEFTAVALRARPTHWAPIRDRYVEITRDCRPLLVRVEEAVDRSPGNCAQLSA